MIVLLPMAANAQTEGWDANSERQEWKDDSVYFSIDWVETKSDGTEVRTKFRLGDYREMKVETDWASFEYNKGQTTSQPEATPTSYLPQARGVKGAQFEWDREEFTVTSKVTLDDSELINRWVALEPNKCKVTYKGKTHHFNQHVPIVSSEEHVNSGTYSDFGRYFTVLSYRMNDKIKYVPAFGTIISPSHEPTFFPEEWGELVDVRQTVANNEAHNSYVYTWSLHFANGYVMPIVVRPGSQDPEWRFQYVEKTTVASYNGGTWQSSTRTWINSTATDETGMMVWSREGTVLTTKSKADAANCNWDDGHGTSVHTNRYNLTIFDGYLRAVDTYTNKVMGIWSSYFYEESVPAFNVRVKVGSGGKYVIYNNFNVTNDYTFNIDESEKPTRMVFWIVKEAGFRLKAVIRDGYDATAYVERNASIDHDRLIFENLCCDTELEFTFEQEPKEKEIINFADSKVKAICVENWDTDGDGELSKTEAAAVTDLGQRFRNSTITSFSELQYFTGLTTISERAFSGCKQLKSITLPTTITSIGDNAFTGCEALEALNIPAKVSSIGESALAGLKSLKTLTVDASNPYFAAEDNVLYTKDRKQLIICAPQKSGAYTVNSNTKELRENAFYLCDKLTDITLPNGLTTIGLAAFVGCGITTLNIPANVTDVGLDYACPNLRSITVDAANPTYMSIDGVLFLRNSQILIAYPAKKGEVYVIPEGTEALQAYSFLESPITDVTLPTTMTQLYDAAFGYSKALRKVTVLTATPPICPSNVFVNSIAPTEGTLYVPFGSKNTYKAATGWKAFSNIVEMEEDGIRSIDNEQLTMDNVIYNISGQRLSKPLRGVNIVDGKKVVVK